MPIVGALWYPPITLPRCLYLLGESAYRKRYASVLSPHLSRSFIKLYLLNGLERKPRNIFIGKTLVQGLLYCCSTFMTWCKRYKANDHKLEDFWRSDTPVGPHSTGDSLSRRWDYLWIVPIRSPPTATRFRHRGRVLLLSSDAALQSDRSQ